MQASIRPHFAAPPVLEIRPIHAMLMSVAVRRASGVDFYDNHLVFASN